MRCAGANHTHENQEENFVFDRVIDLANLFDLTFYSQDLQNSHAYKTIVQICFRISLLPYTTLIAW